MEAAKDNSTASSISAEMESHSRSGTKTIDVENQDPREEKADPTELADEKKVVDDPNVVDWDGPNDPANPLNWPTAKKVAALSLISFITLLS